MTVKPLSQSKKPRSSQGNFSRDVKDSRGDAYQLFVSTQGDRHCLKLYDGSVLIGEARCSWQDDGRMVLDDIAIANEVSPALNFLEQVQQRFLGAEFEPVSYRQRGLGTLLLTNAIEYARTLGAVSLRGEVFQADVENNPGLLNWYERQGFVQSAPQPEQIDVLANITVELRSGGQLEQARVADAIS